MTDNVSIPLRQAVLCSTCDTIYCNSHLVCPKCADANAWPVQAWLSAQKEAA